MEQIPHHREGIQNELDKAYDEAHRDNKAFDEAQAKISEIKGADIARKEYGEIGDKEARGKLSLEETVALLKENGYLDTAFEDKETHELAIRALSRKEAFDGYKQSGGITVVWDSLEKILPYATPEAENLDVMLMNFDKHIESDEAVAEMDRLGVRSLTNEELIQYGIVNPMHQKQNSLVALGSSAVLDDRPRVLILGFGGGERNMGADRRDTVWDSRFRFPVVRK